MVVTSTSEKPPISYSVNGYLAEHYAGHGSDAWVAALTAEQRWNFPEVQVNVPNPAYYMQPHEMPPTTLPPLCSAERP